MANLFLAKNPGPSGSGIHVFIAIPTYSGQVQAPCVHSLLQALPDLAAEGIAHTVMIMAGNCHVDDARNGCLREFMATDCTDLFFIDADVGFAPAAIASLLKHDRDVVAGVYPKKTDDEDFPVTVANGIELWSDADGLVEVEGAPTGFMRIRRNVVEAMFESTKTRRYCGQNEGPDSAPYHIVFERTYEAGRRFSGDYAFCRKWRSMGGKIFVDPELPFSHEGFKEWTGVLGEFWRKKYGVTQSRYESAIQSLRNGDNSPDVFMALHTGWGNQWSATPGMLAVAYQMAKKAKGPILECGSGLTTIVLAIAAESTGQRIVSLEHDPVWHARVSVELRRLGLEADCVLSPIKPFDGGQWYEPPTGNDKFSLVICDGPPRKIGRKGLFAIMADRIEDADLIVDDTEESATRLPMVHWAESHGMEVIDAGRFSVCKVK